MSSVTKNLKTKADLRRVQSFIENHSNLGVTIESFKQALENINSNIRWMKNNYEKIEKWLKLKEKPSFDF